MGVRVGGGRWGPITERCAKVWSSRKKNNLILNEPAIIMEPLLLQPVLLQPILRALLRDRVLGSAAAHRLKVQRSRSVSLRVAEAKAREV